MLKPDVRVPVCRHIIQRLRKTQHDPSGVQKKQR